MSGDELWKREQEEAQQLARLADPLRKTRERIDPMRHAMGESRHKAEEMADPMKPGKEALGALEALPSDWSEQGRTRLHLLGAALLSAQTVANLRPDGAVLCASHLAQELKGKTVEQWLAEKSDAGREEV